MLEITGERRGKRYVVILDGEEKLVTLKSLKYLLMLAWGRLNTPDGWMHRDEIEPGFNQARYLYRMRLELFGDASLPEAKAFIENDRCGMYRLAIAAVCVRTNRLAEIDDHDITRLQWGDAPLRACCA